MRCPFCSFADSKVVDSREVEDSIRRRRECLSCAGRFTTYERVQAVALQVVKKDGRREEFSRGKLLAGVATACEKRPLAREAVEGLVDEIERELYQANEPEVKTSTIGEMVMDRLRALDPIAYVRFASVYRQFTDLADLQAELAALAAAERPSAAQLALSDPEFSATRPRLRPTVATGGRGRGRRPVRPAGPERPVVVELPQERTPAGDRKRTETGS